MRHTRSHHGKEDLEKETITPKTEQLVELVKRMQAVKTDTPQAKANETSMDDNNGKRIKYKKGKRHHTSRSSHS